MKYVPEWVPGAGFKRQARQWRPLYGRMVDAPFEFLKSALVRAVYSMTPSRLTRTRQKSQSAEPSFVAKALSAATSEEQEEIVKHITKNPPVAKLLESA